jgi:hypothetical protein
MVDAFIAGYCLTMRNCAWHPERGLGMEIGKFLDVANSSKPSHVCCPPKRSSSQATEPPKVQVVENKGKTLRYTYNPLCC